MTTTYQKHNCTIEFKPDEDPSDPREWDNVGTMVCWHRDYKLGDRQPDVSGHKWLQDLAGDHCDDSSELTPSQCLDVLKPHYVLLPLGLYDHSGISMYVGSRHLMDSAGWDSGQVGWIYCSLKKALEEWGTKGREAEGWDGPASYPPAIDGRSRTLRESTEHYLAEEVETYNQYLTGDVWGYVVAHDESKEEDSCWGFFGLDESTREAAEFAAEALDQKWKREQAEESRLQKLEQAERESCACRDLITV